MADLTDLIAADLNSHTWGNEYENAAHEEHSFDGGCKICRRAIGAIADRVALAVEQHTNGRITELEAAVVRVEKALEAAEKSVPDDWGVTYIYTSQLRAALEGEQQ